jgi:hypothetical protein
VSTLTLLDGVNAVLKRVGLIQGDAGALTSLSDSARQTDIDICVQCWNEAVKALYFFPNQFPMEAAESTFTLISSVREYDLASDFSTMVVEPKDEIHGYFLRPYPGGYVRMMEDQLIPSNWKGQANFYCIEPINGKLRLDVDPTDNEAGNVYTYRYTKSLEVSSASDTFACADNVLPYLYEPVAQLWNFRRKETFNESLYNLGMSQAMSTLNPESARGSY